MEYQKISNLLNEPGDRPKKFQTKKWIEIIDDRRGTYDDDSQIKFKTTSLMSALCDYSEAYIVVKGKVTVEGAAAGVKVAFKNCAPFTSCISEINNTQVNNAKDLDIIMPMYNFLEYSKNYSDTTGSFYRFSRDSGGDLSTTNTAAAVLGADNAINARPVTLADQGFVAKKPQDTLADGTVDMEIVVPLKYLSNFWRSLEMPLINTEVNLILSWSKNCILTPNAGVTTFAITDSRLYVSEVGLSSDDNQKLLQQLKSGFKRSVFWNEYLSKSEDVIAANANHDFLIDPSFQGHTDFLLYLLQSLTMITPQIHGHKEVITCLIEMLQTIMS